MHEEQLLDVSGRCNLVTTPGATINSCCVPWLFSGKYSGFVQVIAPSNFACAAVSSFQLNVYLSSQGPIFFSFLYFYDGRGFKEGMVTTPTPMFNFELFCRSYVYREAAVIVASFLSPSFFPSILSASFSSFCLARPLLY